MGLLHTVTRRPLWDSPEVRRYPRGTSSLKPDLSYGLRVGMVLRFGEPAGCAAIAVQPAMMDTIIR